MLACYTSQDMEDEKNAAKEAEAGREPRNSHILDASEECFNERVITY